MDQHAPNISRYFMCYLVPACRRQLKNQVTNHWFKGSHIQYIQTHPKFHSQLSSLHQPILKRDGPSEDVSPTFFKPPRFWRSSVMDSLLGTLKVHRCRCHCRYSSKSWFPLWEPQLFKGPKWPKRRGKRVETMWKAHKHDVMEAIAIGLHRWKRCGSQNSDQNKNTYATPQKNCSNRSWLNVIVCQGGEVQNKWSTIMAAQDRISFNHLKH